MNEELGGGPRAPTVGADSIVNRLDGADPDAVWLITGASDGFGRSIATEALHCGRRVVATSNRIENLEKLAPQLRSQLMPIELDVNDESSDRAVIEQAFETFGRIDVVVNNAGYENWHSDLEQGEVLARVQTNLFGALWMSHYATSIMKSAGRGQIVQVFALDENDRLRTPALFERVANALERFCESLAREIALFRLHVGIGVRTDCATQWAVSSFCECQTSLLPEAEGVQSPEPVLPHLRLIRVLVGTAAWGQESPIPD